jgi:acylphosphatase
LVKARIIVRGNVQGVGFRVWVKLFAMRLGIKGLVRNLEDGSIECFLEGSREALGEFVKRVSVKGVPDDPLSMHVGELEVFWEGEPGYESAWREYKGFEIDYGADELKAVDREMLESLEWSKLHFAGMSGVFREELAGMNKVFKEEFAGMSKSFREESAGTNRVFKEQFGDMNRVFREEIGGLKSEFKETRASMEEMREDLKGGTVGIREEIREMHSDMNSSFQEMAKRYDAISSELIRTRAELKRAVDTLVELVEKFVKER